MKNNYELTKKLVREIPNTTIKRFIFASTAAVYGSIKKNKIFENNFISTQSPYGKSKLKAEIFIKKFLKNSKINFIILRLFNVAGANEKFKLGPYNPEYNHIFNKLIRNNKFKIYGTNYNTPDGTAVRDYVHPNDVANAFYKSHKYLVKKNKNEIFNCGSGKAFSVRNIVNSFVKHIDYKMEIISERRRRGDPSYILSNNNQIIRKLNIKFTDSNISNIISSLISWKKKVPIHKKKRKKIFV